MLEKKERSESESTNPGAVPRGDEPAAASTDPEAKPQGEAPGTADSAAAPQTEPQAAVEPKPEKPAKSQKKDKKAKQAGEGKERPVTEPAGPPPEPAPRPRLLEHYEQRVRPKLAQQFGLGNTHQIPKLMKIVLNVGMGDAPKNPKGLEAAAAELAAITGQHAVVTRAKKSVANLISGRGWRSAAR